MMNLLVIDRSDSWHVSDLRRAAGIECQITTATYDDLSVRFDDDNESEFFAGEQLVHQFDAIFTRAMPASSLEQIVFRMDWLNQVEFQLQTPVVNPSRTIECCIDKYLSLEKLRAHKVPVPFSNASQTVDQALNFFENAGCDSVVKPIFGSRGRNIVRLQSLPEAERYFSELEKSKSVIYQQQYIEHGDVDYRLLVVGDQVFGMRRTLEGSWIVNASLGAKCEPHTVSELEYAIAIQAAHSQNAFIVGVDLVYRAKDNFPFVVEVNACPSWRNLSEATDVDISAAVISLTANLANQRFRDFSPV